MRPISKFKISVIGFLGSFLLRLIHLTLRWENQGKLSDPQFWHAGGTRIAAFWHGRQLMMSFSKTDFERKTKLSVLMSEHQDGRMISAAMYWLGISSIPGSSSRSASRSARAMLNALMGGAHVGITPDGPKGPLHQAKAGVVFLASLSGRPIYPFTYSAERYWTFNSWDKMMLPKPFSRAVRIVGEPIYIPRDITSEQLKEYQVLVSQKITEVTNQADAYVYS